MRTTTTAVTETITAVVKEVVVPKKQQVKRSVHNVMYVLLLYTWYSSGVVLVVDAHNEVPGTNTVSIIRTVIYEYI